MIILHFFQFNVISTQLNLIIARLLAVTIYMIDIVNILITKLSTSVKREHAAGIYPDNKQELYFHYYGTGQRPNGQLHQLNN